MECDHCFVWGSPSSKGIFTLSGIRTILAEARKLGTVDHISLEGGEPFLYYPIMVKAAKEAAELSFGVEVLSNCYWGSSREDAVEWLLPLAGIKDLKLSLSSDLYHGEDWEVEQTRNAVRAAKTLGLETTIIAVKYPKAESRCPDQIEGAEVGLWELMYRGRAASQLAPKASGRPWHEFRECPYENLSEPSRVHVDPFGYVHVCQGISIGNAWRKPFSRIIEEYDPAQNPILEPLIHDGPAALAERFGLPHDESYADACHLCYAARCMLRNRYLNTLAPSQMYGEYG